MPLQPSVAKYKLTVNIFKLETRGWKPRLATEAGCGGGWREWQEMPLSTRTLCKSYNGNALACPILPLSPCPPSIPNYTRPFPLPRRICVVEIINRKKTLSKRRPSRAEQRLRGRCCFLYYDYAQKLLLLLRSDAVAVVPSHHHHHQLVSGRSVP